MFYDNVDMIYINLTFNAGLRAKLFYFRQIWVPANSLDAPNYTFIYNFCNALCE